MNKSDLVSAVREQLGVSASRAKTLVDAVLEEVERAVGRGQKVTLSGLGVFEQVVEGAAKVPVFRPAKSLTDAALRRVRETVGEPGDGPRSSATRTPPESSTEQKPTATRTTEKKTAAKKATTTKSGGTRPTAAKTAASTSTAAKTAGTKAAAKKTAAKKTTAKKTTAKKTAARKSTD